MIKFRGITFQHTVLSLIFILLFSHTTFAISDYSDDNKRSGGGWMSYQKFQKINNFKPYEPPVTKVETYQRPAFETNIKTFVESVIIKPFAYVISAVVTIPINIISNLWNLKETKGQSFYRVITDTLKTTVDSIAKISSGVAGSVIQLFAKSELSEKLNNWGTWGKWIDDKQLQDICKPAQNKDILVMCGVGNNMMKDIMLNDDRIVFKDYMNKIMNLESTTANKIDYMSVFTGNAVFDAIMSAFEKCGWQVLSDKIVQLYSKENYQMVIAHSGAGPVLLNNPIPCQTKTFVGAEGSYHGWYAQEQATILVHNNDPIPYISPALEKIGVSIKFGPSDNGIIKTESPIMSYGIEKWHGLKGYLTDIFQGGKR